MPSISTIAVEWSVEIPTKYWTITISSRKLKSFYSETGRLTFNEVPVSDDSSGYRSWICRGESCVNWYGLRNMTESIWVTLATECLLTCTYIPLYFIVYR